MHRTNIGDKFMVSSLLQTALFLWKKRHRKSYELVTLLGLWLMPAIFSVHLRFWRFLLIWAIFSSITARLLLACSRKKMSRTTPRQVRWAGAL